MPTRCFDATTSSPTNTSNCPAAPTRVSTLAPVAFSILAARLAARGSYPQELQ